MNNGAGPTRDKIAPEPTKRPVPIAPPRAKNLSHVSRHRSLLALVLHTEYVDFSARVTIHSCSDDLYYGQKRASV